MAKKKNTRKPTKTRSEIYLSNYPHIGPELEWKPGQVPTPIEKALAFKWYAYMATTDDARGYVSTYLEKIGRSDLSKQLSEVVDTSLPLTACWLARIDELGADIGESHDFILSSVTTSIKSFSRRRVEDSTDPKTQSRQPKVTKAEQIVNNLIGNLEVVIDKEEWDFNVYEALVQNQVATSMVYKLLDYYKPLRDEIKLAVAGTDSDVNEGYSRVKKKNLVAELEWLEQLVDDCTKYGSNQKKIRSPRKTKTVTTEKKLKSFVYKRDDLETKAASVDPVNLIGATSAYLYNTRYKTITVLKGKLDVKGKSIIGHDDSQSMTKSCGRKYMEVIAAIQAGGRISMEKVINGLPTKSTKAKTSVDENTLILRASSF